MKIVMTADLHGKNYAQFATFTKGLSSRLVDLLSVIDDIRVYCEENEVDVAVVIGDIFDERGTIKVPVFNRMYSALKGLSTSVDRLYIVVGNHDQADKDGEEHSVYAFSDFATVVDKVCTIKEEGVLFGFLPYRDTYTNAEVNKITNFAESPSVMFAHVGVIGAVGDNGYEFQHGHKPEALSMDTWDKVFLGHYHTYQRSGNRIYVGSPLQKSFADVGVRKSFSVFNTDTGKSKRVFTDAPTFEHIEVSKPSDVNEIASFEGKNVFLKVTVTDRKINVSKRLKELDFNGRVIVEVKEAKSRSSRIKVDSTSDKDTMVKQYVKNLIPKNLDSKSLIEIGLAAMEGS